MPSTNQHKFNKQLFSKSISASLLVLAPLLASVNVNAADVDELEEVIVSADFRDTTLDDSTVSVSISTQEQLEKRGAEHVEETLNAAPNVNSASGASRARYYQIRGIGERSQFETPVDPSVGLYVDGIDLSRSGGSATLFDVDQVEVIRGPQGTKFGANALAGIINIKANEPTDEWEGKVVVGLGNYDKQSVGIAAGGPLIKDKLLGRFSLHSNESDGYITNTFLNRDDTNNIDEVTARGHLKWLVTQDLTVDLRYLHLDIDNGYDAFNFENDRTTVSDEPGKDKQNTDAFSINTSWDMNDKVTLESSASHSSSNSEYSYDDDWSFVGQFPATDFPYSAFDQYLRKRTNTALEARLLSGDEGRILNDKTDWIVGLYHSDKSEDLTRNYIFLPTSPFVNNYDTKNTALYGQLDTQLTDKTKLITGLRVEKWRADYIDSNNNNLSSDETLYGGKLGLEYEVNENHLTHATISRGYKAGGVNPSNDLLLEQRSFGTELLWNFEVGVNSSFLDDKINTRISTFYAKRKDQQVKDSTPVSNGGATRFIDFTSNAGKGNNYGLEAELDWTVNNKLKLITSIGLLQAEFDEKVRLDGNNEQAHAPNYQYSIGAEYKINPNITTGLSLEGKDGFYFSDSHDERADSYQVVNANISYKRKNMTTTLWARNLLDEDYDTRGFRFGNNPGTGYPIEKFTQKGEPRVFGVNVSIDF